MPDFEDSSKASSHAAISVTAGVHRGPARISFALEKTPTIKYQLPSTLPPPQKLKAGRAGTAYSPGTQDTETEESQQV